MYLKVIGSCLITVAILIVLTIFFLPNVFVGSPGPRHLLLPEDAFKPFIYPYLFSMGFFISGMLLFLVSRRSVKHGG
ncbi:MAG: hypothetical protein COA78_15875 [Blastopirellula sp.]|nr:MAG: hypothetical protein COA78_15875 [Blastopirellula sp.]